MKEKTFITKAGNEGIAYYPEKNDEFTVGKYAKVGMSEHPASVKGKLVIIKSYFLGVITKDGKELSLTLSEGQKKALDKTEDLTGKTIVFSEYEHKQYGKKLGARVKK
jgi:hypothetical protein